MTVPRAPSVIRRQAVFGLADGIVLAVGFVVSFAGHPREIVHAALAAGLAELVGMTSAVWLSETGEGLRPALANGVACLAACFLPAVPYLAGSGWAALVPSLLLTAGIGAVIARLRPERGALAWVQTFGVLGAAAALSCLTFLI